MKQKTRIWVHPAFKRKIKKEATDRDMDVIDLTRLIGESEYDKIVKKYKKQKSRFEFKVQ